MCLGLSPASSRRPSNAPPCARPRPPSHAAAAVLPDLPCLTRLEMEGDFTNESSLAPAFQCSRLQVRGSVLSRTLLAGTRLRSAGQGQRRQRRLPGAHRAAARHPPARPPTHPQDLTLGLYDGRVLSEVPAGALAQLSRLRLAWSGALEALHPSWCSLPRLAVSPCTGEQGRAAVGAPRGFRGVCELRRHLSKQLTTTLPGAH